MLSLADQHLLVSTPEWGQRLYNSYEELHQLITLWKVKKKSSSYCCPFSLWSVPVVSCRVRVNLTFQTEYSQHFWNLKQLASRVQFLYKEITCLPAWRNVSGCASAPGCTVCIYLQLHCSCFLGALC